MASLLTPSTVTSISPNQRHSTTSYRRDRSPPRDPAGLFVCDHQDCHANPPTFTRKCEWNKHLDRHERPYKCHEPGCDITAGFTYSGGLLRHLREVHKKQSPGKKLLHCPYPNCSRAGGDGFTRKENLEEHMRRRHQQLAPQNVDANTLVIANNQPHPQMNGHNSRKRKRPLTPLLAEADDDEENADDTVNQAYTEDTPDLIFNHPVVKRLRADLEECHRLLAETQKALNDKNALLHQQGLRITGYSNLFKSIPNQAYYGANHNPMSPPGSVQGHAGAML